MAVEKDPCREPETDYDGSTRIRRKPLVDYITNEWRTDPKYASPPSASTSDSELLEEFYERVDRWVDTSLAVVKAPKFRRLLLSITLPILFAVLLWIKFVGPWIAEEKAAWASLSRHAANGAEGLFGTNARARFPGMTQVSQLDPKLLPNASGNKRRLIFIGDIHGCSKELEALLQKVHFDARTDTLLSVGDILSKGPDSLGVIDLLRQHGAYCVRGNHEDRLLLYAGHAKDTSLRTGKQNVGTKSASKHFAEKKLAKELSHDQLSYLRSFPLALEVGDVDGLGAIVMVHAGLIPGLPIDNQDPSSIMNMRMIDLKTHVPSKKHERRNSIPWFKLWNKFQRLLPSHRKLLKPLPGLDAILSRRTTVVYGHDSKRGLQIGRYTKGLDTGCVKGGKLTALIVSEGGRQEIVQVDCLENYTRKPDLDDVLSVRNALSVDGED